MSFRRCNIYVKYLQYTSKLTATSAAPRTLLYTPFTLISSRPEFKYIYKYPTYYILKKNLNCIWHCIIVLSQEFSGKVLKQYGQMCLCGTALHYTNRNSDKGVEIAFLGTRTGLSRTNQFVPSDQLSNQ